MLVLTRKLGESMQIGDNVRITVVAVQGQTIRLGMEAPKSIRILRGELAGAEARQANETTPDAAGGAE